MNEFKESRPLIERKKFIEVVGNIDLTRKKLTGKQKFSVAFLLSDKDFKIYVSPDNSHEKAAKMAGMLSNNSKDVLVKGRISPQVSAFIFNEKGSSSEDFLKDNIEQGLIDNLIPQIASALRDWLGEEFENYAIHYK